MNLTTKLKCRPGIRYRMVGGEGILIAQDEAEVMAVNGVGARVVELMRPEASLGEIVSTLADEYESPEDVIERDVRRFVDELFELGVVEQY